MRSIGNDLSAKKQNNFIASGTLANGESVVVNANGTVSTVGLTAVSASDGNVVVADTNGNTYDFAACYDSTNKKVVAFYNRQDDLIGVVGTVTGTSISFGTPVTVNTSATGNHNALFIPSTSATGPNKVVWIGRVGFAVSFVVCEVSGTTLTFGGLGSLYNNGDSVVATYDPVNDRIIAMFRDKNISNYPVLLMGTISGTSITPGSGGVQTLGSFNGNNDRFAITFDTNDQSIVAMFLGVSYGYPRIRCGKISDAATGTMTFGTTTVVSSSAGSVNNQPALSFDPDQKSIVISWRGSTSGHQVVGGSVSSSNITISGTVTTVNNTTTQGMQLVYDSTAKRTILWYSRDTSYGYYRVIRMDGTTAYVGDEVTVLSQSTTGVTRFGLAYDSEQSTSVVFWRKVSSSNHAAAVPFQIDHFQANLTSENFIGMPESRVANSAMGTVKTQGAISKNAFNKGYVITVQSVSGNNKYFIDGVQQDTLTLYRGNTYFFDWSAATTHPFSFSLTSDNSGNSEYTTGVTKDNSAYTTSITVDSSAPSTLYYYCSAHSGMGGSATISNVIPGKTYYLQTSGYLTTSAGSPSVVAGTALSTTELIVKG